MDAYKRWLIPRSVARAKIVLTVSEHASSEILRAFPRANVRVIPCSIPQNWFRPRPRDERSGYVLMVTSGAPHKNAIGGLKGYAEYARRAGTNARPLKIVGLGANAPHYRDLASQLAVARLVSFLPYLSEQELIACYQDAGALLFPSFAEGFGIPLLEAMATGTPAIVARAASLPEVGADAACYFDPADIPGIGDALERVLVDEALRESMARRGLQRAQVYHPEVVAKQVRAFWEEVAGVRIAAPSNHHPSVPTAEGATAELENVGAA
jgi:alpha-1,3-rhamnosyl/mannosyltransferase